MAAAMVGDVGRVVAVERDLNRFKVLKSMCQKAGATSELNSTVVAFLLPHGHLIAWGRPADVTPMNTDFLSIKPDDVKFKNISHILVDPSCCEDAPLALLSR